MEQTPYERLEAFWHSKGIRNMSAFADAVRLKPGTLSAIKQRASKPTAAVLEVIQRVFPDMSPDYILWGRVLVVGFVLEAVGYCLWFMTGH